MKIRFLVQLFFLFLPILLMAQQNYDSLLLEKFTDSYFMEKELSKLPEEKIEALFKKHEITKIEYASYHAGNRDEQVNVDKMLRLNKALQAFQKSFQEQIDINLSKYCFEIGIEYQVYLEIKQKYRESIQFNRELKPYFDKKLYSRHDE